MKDFIISIDTEEDNQWDTSHIPSTENVKYLPRFQELCEEYGFIPTYLTTYGMAKDPSYVSYMKEKFHKKKCEIGMHMHAWDVLPTYHLKSSTKARPYITEYPIEIIEQKVECATTLLSDVFEKKIVSHRSGRWAINDNYLSVLAKYGYEVDCSVTPLMDWTRVVGATSAPGNNYARESLYPTLTNSGIVEIPMTIRKIHTFNIDGMKPKSIAKGAYYMCLGEKVWLRPDNTEYSNRKMKKLVDSVIKDNKADYLMFMIHSSELMPGGSPNFTNNESIERLYANMKELFDYLKPYVIGCAMSDYAERCKKNGTIH